MSLPPDTTDARRAICARLSLAGLALLLAGPVRAAEPQPECPGASALQGAGILLTRNAPRMSEALRFENGTLTGYRADDPATGRAPLRETYPHPLAVGLREMGGREFALRYTKDPAELDTLPQTRRWSSPVALVVDGQTEREGTITYSYRGEGTVEIGACSYPAWQVIERIDLGDLSASFLKEYAPDPGLVLRATKLDPATGAPLAQVAFDTISLRPRPQSKTPPDRTNKGQQ
ncbi:hypothetical protein FGG78_07620 [Thioclava sp. BHET1]|nr:hypothetical protein FGG78_07620 [Thioclava sp. BHET1]